MKKHVLNWIGKYGEISKRICEEENVPFQLCWAQAMLESGEGKNILASNYNFFGIKYRESLHQKYVQKWTWEWRDGKKEKVFSKFAAFNSLEEGFRGYVQFIGRDRYQHELVPLLRLDPVRYVTWLWACGYATAQNYVPAWVSRSQKIYKTTGDESFNLKVDKGLAACLKKLKKVTGSARRKLVAEMLVEDCIGKMGAGNWTFEKYMWRVYKSWFGR